MTFLLLWFTIIPELGVRYYHLGSYDSEIICKNELKIAAVLVKGPTETIKCIGVNIK
jgi:hypothetical protein|tara:strand:+ start:2610 stop:2780 length:171 start_codon:yes stop_codon:yes gene_type:complete